MRVAAVTYPEPGNPPPAQPLPCTLLEAARWYVSQGFPVFPCVPRGKKPITEHGYKNASTDLDQIERWWTENPDANIGFPTEGHPALDIDPRHGGNESLEALIHKHGPLPETAEQNTGGGGRHFLFRDPGIPLTVQIAPGVELSGKGGKSKYIIVAPSIHASGTPYQWDGLAGAKALHNLAEVPQWLLDLIISARAGKTQPVLAGQPVDKIPEGQRNGTLASIGGTMRRRGMTHAAIEAALLVENRERCEPQLPEDEVRTIAKSIASYPPEPEPVMPEPPAGWLTWPEDEPQPESAGPVVTDDPAAPLPKRPARNPLPEVLSVDKILALKVSPPRMLIESLIPLPGAILVVGAQKSGKTVLAVQVAIATASGHALLDNYRILETGPVLMVEQDDPAGAASVKDYLKSSPVPTKGIPFYLVPRVSFSFGPEFLTWLQSQISALGLRLIILDSYTALRASRRAGGDIVKVEQAEMTLLDDLGKKNGCTILVLTHDSKGSFGMDWSDRTAGTFAMGMAVEGQIHVSRFPDLDTNAPERLVRMRGRHCDGVELVLRFRKSTLDYEIAIEGPAAQFYPLILQISETFGTQPFSPKDLYLELGIARATAHRLITRLHHADALTKRGTGSYALTEKLGRLRQ